MDWPLPFFLLVALVVSSPRLAAQAEEAEAADQARPEAVETLLTSLPGGAIAFAETSGLADLIAALRDSAVIQSIFASPQFAEFQETENFEKAENARKLAEFMLRMDLWEASAKLLGGRVAAGLYPKEGDEDPDFLLVLKPADQAAWAKQRIWINPLLALAAERVKRPGWDRIKVYRVKDEEGGGGALALHRNWIAVSSNPDLLEQAISLQEHPAPDGEPNPDLARLSDVPAFHKMDGLSGREHLARVLVDTATISQATGGRLGLPEKMDNVLVSLIGGGIVELAARSSVATVTLDTSADGFLLEAALDGDPKALDEQFGVYFSDPPGNGARALPEVPGLVGGFTIYRDIATWYRSREALLVESVLPEFDKFEAGIGNLLPGKDVGEDVFPLLGDRITFVSALQDYDHLAGEPGVKLPAFAFLVELAQPQEGADIFRLFFQTLLSVLNLEAAKQNRQPWLIETESHGEVQISTARYLEAPEGDHLPIVFNFLPASARVGDTFILSSSLALCRDLIDALQVPAEPERLGQNLGFEVRFEPLTAGLEANREHLLANRVSEGRTAEQAQADIDLFLSLLRHLDSLSLATSAGEEGVRLQLRGAFEPSPK